MNEISVLTFKNFEPYPEVLCAFSTRLGGYSSEMYTSLNLGLKTGDVVGKVIKNRQIFFKSLSIKEGRIAYGDQIHSANVAIVNHPGIFHETDALISSQKNIFLTVQTADCFPVFLYDPKSATIGLVHAGWRGTRAGILENVFNILKHQLKTEMAHLLAAIGPGLQKECFEVRKDVGALFDEEYLLPHQDSDKKYLDLFRVIMDRLVNQGIRPENIDAIPACTMCSQDKFYSYRRDKNTSGRMMGIIGIR